MSEIESGGTREQWHLDKKVPVAMIIGLGAQTLAAVWWAAGVNGRVEALERQVMTYGPVAERVLRIEGKIDSFKETLTDIKQALQQSFRAPLVYEVQPPSPPPTPRPQPPRVPALRGSQ
jgi:hypothetical protein